MRRRVSQGGVLSGEGGCEGKYALRGREKKKDTSCAYLLKPHDLGLLQHLNRPDRGGILCNVNDVVREERLEHFVRTG